MPEIIWQLSQQVALGAGDIIMTGTPAGVAALSPGDKIECGVDGIGTLKVSIGEPDETAPRVQNTEDAGPETPVWGLFVLPSSLSLALPHRQARASRLQALEGQRARGP